MKPQQHQHGPNCNHGPKGHSHSPPNPNQFFSNQLSFPDYRQSMKKMWDAQRQFYWLQILNGALIERFLLSKNLLILRLFSCIPLQMIGIKLQSYTDLQCFPNEVRALIGGMLLPLALVFFFMNNVFHNYSESPQGSIFSQIFLILVYLTLGLYVMCAFRGSGNLSTKQNEKHTKQAIKTRPYLQNHSMTCSVCKILKAYRAHHCPICKQCVPKYTKHSMIFNQCIGAANQFPIMVFLLSLSVTGLFGFIEIFRLFYVSKFVAHDQKVQSVKYIGYFITFVVSYINWFVTWNAFVQFSRMLIHNIYYGITEYELNNWTQQQYLFKIPMRQFQNNLNSGMVHNYKESVAAFFGCKGVETQYMKALNEKYAKSEIDMQDAIEDELKNPLENLRDSLGFPKVETNKKHLMNWNLAYCYLMPMIANHPMREFLTEMMQTQEPKMVQNYRLGLKLKKQVIDQNKKEGKEPLSQGQLGRRVMMKMQKHMMKNSPQQGFGPGGIPVQMHSSGKQPTDQQKKIIMMQILEHLGRDIAEHPEKKEVDQLMEDLRSDKIAPVDVNMELRRIQQNIMKRKMQDMLKKHQGGQATLQSANQPSQIPVGRPMHMPQIRNVPNPQSSVNGTTNPLNLTASAIPIRKTIDKGPEQQQKSLMREEQEIQEDD